MPHRPARPAKSEGGRKFKLVSEYEPAGDQPTAIKELVEGLMGTGAGATSFNDSGAGAGRIVPGAARKNVPSEGIAYAAGTIVPGERDQVLLGVTGSGKTFTMAKVIEAVQRPALILAPNKTLAAQLYSEMKQFFPENAVEYFVSYYDYYQPEAYIPRTDTYIEKDSSINEEIDRMRHSATRAILERDDVIIVASVSCIYGIGSVETYSGTAVTIAKGQKLDRNDLMRDLSAPCNAPPQRRGLRAAARSASAAIRSTCSPRITKTAPGASNCSATMSTASASSIRSPAAAPASSNR